MYGIPIHDGAGEVGQCIVLCSTNDRWNEDTVAVHLVVLSAPNVFCWSGPAALWSFSPFSGLFTPSVVISNMGACLL